MLPYVVELYADVARLTHQVMLFSTMLHLLDTPYSTLLLSRRHLLLVSTPPGHHLHVSKQATDSISYRVLYNDICLCDALCKLSYSIMNKVGTDSHRCWGSIPGKCCSCHIVFLSKSLSHSVLICVKHLGCLVGFLGSQLAIGLPR